MASRKHAVVLLPIHQKGQPRDQTRRGRPFCSKKCCAITRKSLKGEDLPTTKGREFSERRPFSGGIDRGIKKNEKRKKENDSYTLV